MERDGDGIVEEDRDLDSLEKEDEMRVWLSLLLPEEYAVMCQMSGIFGHKHFSSYRDIDRFQRSLDDDKWFWGKAQWLGKSARKKIKRYIELNEKDDAHMLCRRYRVECLKLNLALLELRKKKKRKDK